MSFSSSVPSQQLPQAGPEWTCVIVANRDSTFSCLECLEKRWALSPVGRHWQSICCYVREPGWTQREGSTSLVPCYVRTRWTISSQKKTRWTISTVIDGQKLPRGHMLFLRFCMYLPIPNGFFFFLFYIFLSFFEKIYGLKKFAKLYIWRCEGRRYGPTGVPHGVRSRVVL
jgi:hypothetical protein